ncbi:MAG TPA: glycosyltransferase [Solirubrobacteraceae bacterium]|nr:glycosyltransferase [Solirubrobacteraceae bacterium]
MIVLVAARNEAERIGATLAALREAFPAARLWVADDGSRDGTAQLATAAGAEVIGGAWVGKGGAITRVARRALASTGSEGGDGRVEGSVAGGSGVAAVEEIARSEARAPIVLLCDGDLGASAARLSALVEAVRDDEADLAVARFARPVGGGFGLTLGFARWAVRRRCAQATRAPLSGQRALRADALARLLPLAAGYGMEVGMTIDAARAGLRVREIELDLAHRSRGRTPRGFAHRARQLFDVARAYAVRR